MHTADPETNYLALQAARNTRYLDRPVLLAAERAARELVDRIESRKLQAELRTSLLGKVAGRYFVARAGLLMSGWRRAHSEALAILRHATEAIEDFDADRYDPCDSDTVFGQLAYAARGPR